MAGTHTSSQPWNAQPARHTHHPKSAQELWLCHQMLRHHATGAAPGPLQLDNCCSSAQGSAFGSAVQDACAAADRVAPGYLQLYNGCARAQEAPPDNEALDVTLDGDGRLMHHVCAHLVQHSHLPRPQEHLQQGWTT